MNHKKLRKLIREQIESLLKESVTIGVTNLNYDDELENILDISHYVVRQVARDFFPKNLKPEEMEGLFIGETFTPDGGMAFQPTGIMNFYLYEYPQHLIEPTLGYIKYILGEKNIKVGECKREGDRVIRIPIIENKHTNDNPPTVQFSIGNAKFIFCKVLGFCEDKFTYNMPIPELLLRIKKLGEEGFSKYVEEPVDHTSGSVNIFDGTVRDWDFIAGSISKIKAVIKWAQDRGYTELYAA